jgi:mono/diheme cytochrome c family protein
MKRRFVFSAACMLSAAFMMAGHAAAAGDPARGEKLHQDCLGCHGTELYVPPKAKIKVLSTLKKEVEKWNDRMNPKFTRQEVEDLVAYLNRDFYKFPK